MTTITKHLFATLLSSVCLGVAQATPVTVDFGIPGDLLVAPYNNANAGWYVEFTSGDPSLRIDSVTVNIAPRLRVNVGGCLLTNGCGFDAAAVAGANVGTPGFTGSSSIANGTASFTLNFAGFDPGERFRFLLDLDDTIIVPFPANPFSNAVTAADLIDGANTISYSVQFSGTGYTTTSLTGALSFSETLDTSELPADTVAVLYGRGTLRGDVAPAVADVPEPSSVGLLFAALGGMALMRSRGDFSRRTHPSNRFA